MKEILTVWWPELVIPPLTAAAILILDHYSSSGSWLLPAGIVLVVVVGELCVSFSLRTLKELGPMPQRIAEVLNRGVADAVQNGTAAAKEEILRQLSIVGNCVPIYAQYASQDYLAEEPLPRWF